MVIEEVLPLQNIYIIFGVLNCFMRVCTKQSIHHHVNCPLLVTNRSWDRVIGQCIYEWLIQVLDFTIGSQKPLVLYKFSTVLSKALFTFFVYDPNREYFYASIM